MNGWTLYLLLIQVVNIILVPLQIGKPREPWSPGMGVAVAAWSVINFWVICKATELI